MSNLKGKFLLADTKPFVLYVNSKDRTQNSKSQSLFRVNFNFAALHVNYVKILQATIPNVFYTFRDDEVETNNWFDFVDSIGIKSFQITPGSYSISNLIAELLNKFASVSPDTYTITYDQNTLKLTITSSYALFSILGLTGPNIGSNSLYFLGYNNVDTTPGTVQLAPNTINISGPNNIFIRIQQFGNPIHSSLNNLSAIFYIPITASYGNVNYFAINNQYNSTFKVDLQSLSFLDIAVIGSDGHLMDFHGVDWDMLLEFL